MGTIRISCAGLSSIKIGDKYLLIQNSNSRQRGSIVYGPVGGALEYDDRGQEFLSGLGFIPERVTNDLRFQLPIDKLDLFHDWFMKRDGREDSNFREMFEELVLEEKILPCLNKEDLVEDLVKITYFRKNSPHYNNPSLYYFEIFEIKFTKRIEEELLNICNDPKSTVKLFTKEEIESGCNGEVTSHSIHILN